MTAATTVPKAGTGSLEEDAVRLRLRRAVYAAEARDLAVPFAVGIWSTFILFLAWGFAKDIWSAGDYFLAPCLISAVGLVAGQIPMGPWWFNRHKAKARVLTADPPEDMSYANISRARVDRAGLPVPGGPPSLVTVEASFPDGRNLVWQVQVRAQKDAGIGAGVPANEPVALLGTPAPGNWLLGLAAGGDILWPTTGVTEMARTHANA
ncbi:MAG: hypothetical protein ACRD0J_00715 [Acidimicrobiales bacterium]